jgi:hypothetical protein
MMPPARARMRARSNQEGGFTARPLFCSTYSRVLTSSEMSTFFRTSATFCRVLDSMRNLLREIREWMRVLAGPVLGLALMSAWVQGWFPGWLENLLMVAGVFLAFAAWLLVVSIVTYLALRLLGLFLREPPDGR